MSGPALGWVAQARVLMTATDPSLEELARWLGGDVERGTDGLRAGEGALPGATTVTLQARDGVPDSLSVWYPPETGPTLAEAVAELGPAHELGRLLASPPQLSFPAYEGADATCFIAATTWDAAELGGRRRLFQLILRRDEIVAP